MNKTININLGGIFFHIDEEAYQKLKRYIDAIRRSLSDDPQGKDEIITDIESRISELLSERVKDARQVVNESDINEVISIMGQPEDYSVDEELFEEGTRKSYSNKNASKRLLRDGDDKFLGGVSSGIAYYFNIDVIWVRLAWLIASFGFGFGFLVYLILWILLPEAKTTAEKLQMEGTPVNIANIEKKIREEFDDVSERVKGAAGNVSDAVKEGYDTVSDSIKKKKLKRSQSRARSGSQDIIDTLGKVIGAIFMVIGKFIGVLLIVISVAVMIGLVVSLFTAGAADFIGIDTFFNGNIELRTATNMSVWVISLLVLALVGIPFLMLFFLGLFILSSKSKVLNRTTKFVLLGIWIIALLGAIFIGLKQAKEFAHNGSVTKQTAFVSIPSDTLTIKMIDNEILYNNNEFRRSSNFRKVLDENDKAKYYSNDLRVNIKMSDSTETYIKVKKEANGSTRLFARSNAEQTVYDFMKTGNTLALDNYFLTDTKTGFKDQEVRITLYIPKDQVLYFDESTRHFLNYDIKTVRDIYRGDMKKHHFKMTEDGLDCLDCEDEDFWKNDEETNDDEEGLNVKIDEDGVRVNINDGDDSTKLNIDEDGVNLKVKDGDENAELKIDENGLHIDGTNN